MAWNEPGGGNNSNNQDPWGSGGNRGGGNRGGKQGPPDLDEALRKLQDSLNGIFGSKKRGSGDGGNGRRVGGGQGIPKGSWAIGGLSIFDFWQCKSVDKSVDQEQARQASRMV